MLTGKFQCHRSQKVGSKEYNAFTKSLLFLAISLFLYFPKNLDKPKISQTNLKLSKANLFHVFKVFF